MSIPELRNAAPIRPATSCCDQAVRYLYTLFGQAASGHLAEICIQTSDKADWSLEARRVTKVQESERSRTGAAHAAVSNQLRKSSLHPAKEN